VHIQRMETILLTLEVEYKQVDNDVILPKHKAKDEPLNLNQQPPETVKTRVSENACPTIHISSAMVHINMPTGLSDLQ
jgi:hypothetical protein